MNHNTFTEDLKKKSIGNLGNITTLDLIDRKELQEDRKLSLKISR